VREVISAAGFAIALSCSVNESDVAGRAGSEKAPLDSACQLLGMPGPDEPAAGDGISIADQSNRIINLIHLARHVLNL
jgi:hypothetical protein